MDLFSFAMYVGSDGQATASPLEISDLFDVCVYLLSEEEICLILDGLDECHDLDSELMPKLCKFGHLYPIKLALLSRETVKSSVKSVPNLRIVNIGSLNQKDIQLYLRRELGTLVDNRLLPKDLNLDETTHKLARRADGMFLWARLMITYLKSPALLHSDRLTAISEVDMPEGLEQMYERIIRHIASQGQASASLASYVCTWLIYGRRELTLRELENAVISRKRGGANEGTRSLEGFPDTVVAVCGGFVECHSAHPEENPDSRPVRFIHLSIKEYLTKAPSCNINRSGELQGLAILTSSFQANVRLATLCVEYLTYSMPAESLSVNFGSRMCRTNVELAFPLGNYVVSHWTDHLLATESTVATTRSIEQDGPGDYKKLVSTLCTFLSQPKVLTTWIEACYIFDRPPPFRNLSEWAASTPQSSWGILVPEVSEVATEVEKFSSYLMKLSHDWGLQLERDPGCVWVEVGAFTPSPFVVQNSGINLKQLVSEVPVGTRLCHRPINKVSRLVADGVFDMALSVFPTRYFQLTMTES
jgi:hypothetical protein